MKRKPFLLIPALAFVWMISSSATLRYVTGQYTGSGADNGNICFPSWQGSHIKVYAVCTDLSENSTDRAVAWAEIVYGAAYQRIEATMGSDLPYNYEDSYDGTPGVCIDYNLSASGYSTTAWLDEGYSY